MLVRSVPQPTAEKNQEELHLLCGIPIPSVVLIVIIVIPRPIKSVDVAFSPGKEFFFAPFAIRPKK